MECGHVEKSIRKQREDGNGDYKGLLKLQGLMKLQGLKKSSQRKRLRPNLSNMIANPSQLSFSSSLFTMTLQSILSQVKQSQMDFVPRGSKQLWCDVVLMSHYRSYVAHCDGAVACGGLTHQRMGRSLFCFSYYFLDLCVIKFSQIGGLLPWN